MNNCFIKLPFFLSFFVLTSISLTQQAAATVNCSNYNDSNYGWGNSASNPEARTCKVNSTYDTNGQPDPNDGKVYVNCSNLQCQDENPFGGGLITGYNYICTHAPSDYYHYACISS